jgi:vitamin-K-epoxide reductase (warfarin-sensitive)
MPLGLDQNFYTIVLPLVVAESVLYWIAFSSAEWRTYQVYLGLLGLWWCFAALWVEINIEHTYPGFDYEHPVDPEMKAYRPFCDFAPWAACSKVLMSPPGRFLRYFGIAKEGGGDGVVNKVRGWIDVPNPSLGVIFFGVHLFYPALLLIGPPYIPLDFLGFVPVIMPWVLFGACCGVGCMTIWLAYNLFFKLKDFCVVCVSMYVANFALIPMMYNLAKQNATFDVYEKNGFFGDVPQHVLYPFLAMDAIMGVAVVALYIKGGFHSTEYIKLGP